MRAAPPPRTRRAPPPPPAPHPRAAGPPHREAPEEARRRGPRTAPSRLTSPHGGDTPACRSEPFPTPFPTVPEREGAAARLESSPSREPGRPPGWPRLRTGVRRGLGRRQGPGSQGWNRGGPGAASARGVRAGDGEKPLLGPGSTPDSAAAAGPAWGPARRPPQGPPPQPLPLRKVLRGPLDRFDSGPGCPRGQTEGRLCPPARPHSSAVQSGGSQPPDSSHSQRLEETGTG